MNVFEPLFLALALVATVTLLTAGIAAIRGQFARAARILRRLGVCATVYFAVVIAVSALGPQRVYQVGETQCFDDWCIQVAHAQWSSDGAYRVTLRLSNRAKRVPMGEAGTVVYVVDAHRRRIDPRPDASDVPLDVILQPGETREVTRTFEVPRDTPDLGLVFTHEGGFPIGWFIITEGGWFQDPPVVRLTTRREPSRSAEAEGRWRPA